MHILLTWKKVIQNVLIKMVHIQYVNKEHFAGKIYLYIILIIKIFIHILFIINDICFILLDFIILYNKFFLNFKEFII